VLVMVVWWWKLRHGAAAVIFLFVWKIVAMCMIWYTVKLALRTVCTILSVPCRLPPCFRSVSHITHDNSIVERPMKDARLRSPSWCLASP
jgi:hypothetical protein